MNLSYEEKEAISAEFSAGRQRHSGAKGIDIEGVRRC